MQQVCLHFFTFLIVVLRFSIMLIVISVITALLYTHNDWDNDITTVTTLLNLTITCLIILSVIQSAVFKAALQTSIATSVGFLPSAVNIVSVDATTTRMRTLLGIGASVQYTITAPNVNPSTLTTMYVNFFNFTLDVFFSSFHFNHFFLYLHLSHLCDI